MSIFDLLFAAANNGGENSIYLGNLSLKQDWRAIAYGNGTFVAVANGSSTAVYSKDGGKTFTPSSLPTSAMWVDVVYCGDDTFIAIPASATLHPARSTDGGKTWSNLPSRPATNMMLSIGNKYANGVLVLIGSGGGRFAYSIDKGDTWISSSSTNLAIGINSYSYSLEFGNGVFLAFGNDPWSGSKASRSSDNGKTWSLMSLPVAGSGACMTFDDGVFVASTATKDKIAYSNDNGASWTMATISGSYTGLRQTESGSGVFLGMAPSINTVIYSEDGGKNWKKQTLPNAWGYQDVAYGDGVFVAVAQHQSQATIIKIAPSV